MKGRNKWVNPVAHSIMWLAPLAVPSSMGWKLLVAHARGGEWVSPLTPLMWPASGAAISFQPIELGIGSGGS